MNKIIKIPFIEKGTDIPIIQLQLKNSEEVNILIDSGSDSSLIDKDFVKRNKKVFKLAKDKNAFNYIGLNAEKTVPTVNVNGQFVISREDNTIDLMFSLFDLSQVIYGIMGTYDIYTPVLIGSDILKSLNAKIDYENKFLTIEI